jgi:hypothetical protein
MSPQATAVRTAPEASDVPALRCAPDKFPASLTHGSLETYGVEQVMLGLRAGQRSGTLVFGPKDAPNAQLVFEHGFVRKVRSSLSAYLGGVLYELGYVDPVTLNASLAAVAQTRVPHGAVLQKQCAVSKDHIQKGLLEQMERRIADLIGMEPETAWAFHEDKDLLPSYGGSDWPLVDPLSGVWRGLRQSARLDLMHAVLASAADDRFVLVRGARLDALKLQPEELAIAESFRNARTVKPTPSSLSATTVASLTYVLLAGGFLEGAPRFSALLRIEHQKSVRIESSPHLALQRIRALAMADRHREAVSVAESSIELFPDAVELQVEAAWLGANEPGAVSRRRDEEQVRVMDGIVAAHPTCANAFFYRFKLLRRLGEAAEAVVDLRHAVELDGRHADATQELRLLEARMAKGQSVEVALLTRVSGVQRR